MPISKSDLLARALKAKKSKENPSAQTPSLSGLLKTNQKNPSSERIQHNSELENRNTSNQNISASVSSDSSTSQSQTVGSLENAAIQPDSAPASGSSSGFSLASALAQVSNSTPASPQTRVQNNQSLSSNELSSSPEMVLNESEIPEPRASESPTLEDLHHFTFESQEDSFDIDLLAELETKLNSIVNSLGREVQTALSDTLQFLKSHPDLTAQLRPESKGIMVDALRKSYGYVVQSKTDNKIKRKRKEETVNAIAESLPDFNLF